MIIQPDIPVILASASPRRRELLTTLGLQFKIIPAHINEAFYSNELPIKHVCRLAGEKGKNISDEHPEAVVISSDTIVVYQNNILGKPADEDDAFRMLRFLSGNTHEVITAFSIICRKRNINVLEYETTEVVFRNLSDEDIRSYIAGGSPMDKAGAYGIQDLDANFVKKIKGCFYNVIGFPIAAFTEKWNVLFSN
ncbi:MAG: septum formation protein Maf [Candidatus Marinimicrobia bacterium]|nr:septum formation protein Maf [Candidatus Neomarinimicrobiota bacterium]